MNNLEKSRNIRDTAKRFILQRKISELLSSYGKTNYVGSFQFDLMSWNDIDIHLDLHNKTIDPIKQFGQIAVIFLLDNNVHSVKLINFSIKRNSSMPCGAYMGINYQLKPVNQSWKVDIWALDNIEQKKHEIYSSKVLENLTFEKKKLILDWKFKLMKSNYRVPKQASYLLYQAILFYNLKSDIDVRNFLIKHRVIL